MHGNQWVLKIAVLKYYSVSKRGTTAKSNPKQATDPISLHTKFGDNSSNTFPLNERKPCVTPDIGRRMPDAGHRTAKKAKIIYPPPRGVDIIICTWTQNFKKYEAILWVCNNILHIEYQILVLVLLPRNLAQHGQKMLPVPLPHDNPPKAPYLSLWNLIDIIN